MPSTRANAQAAAAAQRPWGRRVGRSVHAWAIAAALTRSNVTRRPASDAGKPAGRPTPSLAPIAASIRLATWLSDITAYRKLRPFGRESSTTIATRYSSSATPHSSQYVVAKAP